MKLGYPRTFPRSVVYASTSRGGLGFRHLGHEQGVQKCMQLIKQMRANTSVGRTSQIILEHYQLMAGLSKPILEDTRSLPWSNSKWFDTARQFLHEIDGQIIQQNPWKIPKRRTGNRHLMEDVLSLNLPNNKAMQVQSVCLYLRVSVLSEITNHCGTHLLPCVLQHSHPTPNNPYTTRNHSRLVWPYQPTPGPNAWKTWREVLSVLYLQHNSYALSQPLGEWTQDYDVDYNWTWRVCPRSKILFHQHKGQWIAFTQATTHHNHIQYQLHVSSTSTPANTVPVTPILLSNSIRIQVPIPNIMLPHPTVSINIPLATRLNTPDTDWEANLWHEIRPHTHTDQLRQALLSKDRIILVSDAAVHNSGQATCTWVIWAKQTLWSGEGYVPGNHDETNSGVAEAFGITTVLGFLSNYLRLYPIIFQRQRKVTVYCDNQGVIEWINNTGGNLYARDTIRDEYPVFAEIQHQI